MEISSFIDNYKEDIKQHRVWLKNFNERRLKKWDDLLQANPEAAICEAKTRLLMADHNVDIQPYEDLSQGGPDFECSKNGRAFYVETTCISIEAATRESSLEPIYNLDVDDSGYYDMTEKFRSEIGGKVKQCSKVVAPRIVVIGTLHPQASDCCFDELAAEEVLTGTTYITGKINTRTGEKVGDTYEVTKLEDSAFIRPSKESTIWIEHARCSVSAVLLCGFGSNPPNIVGCLHPSPAYAFDKVLLPRIHFFRLVDGYQKGPLQVEKS
ncbi:MAG: hypothetical protein ACYSWQ_22440 [Planctomycetota bacterium]|jgi:hypothetical protein